MKRSHIKIGGTAMTLGLIAGSLAGAVFPAGAASVNLLTTNTSVEASPDTTSDSSPVTVLATVTLELVKGALVTPSGEVNFSLTSGGVNSPLPSEPISSCLLGLPSLLGIWTETCTATLKTADLECSMGTIWAVYSGSTDLVAEASKDSTKIYSGC
jgi:hypothetical protein